MRRLTRSRSAPGGCASPDYQALRAGCRASLLAVLEDAPCSDVLISLFGRGKMVRATLVFTATAAVGGRPSQVALAAEAVELLHGASLIHDDIVDDAQQRRGLPAVHLCVPSGGALVLGDYLILRALTRLTEAQGLHGRARVLRALETLMRAAEDCCRGQIDEILASSLSWGEDDYLAAVGMKTASQFVAAAQLGPILVGAPEGEIDALGIYATAVGTSFQILDDTLDLLGHPDVLGKPVGNSLARGRPSLPAIYLFEHGSAAAIARYREMERLRAPVAQIVRLLADEGMIARAQTAHQRERDRASQALNKISRPDGRAALEAFGRALPSWELVAAGYNSLIGTTDNARWLHGAPT
jgi:octaprenyl-diphosphate synthase